MDCYGFNRALLRSEAQTKVALYSLRDEKGKHGETRVPEGFLPGTSASFDTLLRSLPSKTTKNDDARNGKSSRVQSDAISSTSLETLVTLAKSAKSVRSLGRAKRLLQKLGEYLQACQHCLFALSPLLKELDPSPWDYLTSLLISSVATLKTNFSNRSQEFGDIAADYIWTYLETYRESSIKEDSSTDTFIINTFSFLGLLHAFQSHHVLQDLFPSNSEKVRLIQVIESVISHEYLSKVENKFLKIGLEEPDVNHLWIYYYKRYMAQESPLGALEIQRRVLLICGTLASLFVKFPNIPDNNNNSNTDDQDGTDIAVNGNSEDKNKNNSDTNVAYSKIDDIKPHHTRLLDKFFEGGQFSMPTDPASSELLKTLSATAEKIYRSVEDGVDYINLQYSPLLFQAFVVKAFSLEILCFATMSGFFDPGHISLHIRDVLNSQSQMSDEYIFEATINSIAVLSRSNSGIGGTLTQIVPPMLVSSSVGSRKLNIATDALVYELKAGTQDAVISCLYTLVNSLTTGPETITNHSVVVAAAMESTKPADDSQDEDLDEIHERKSLGLRIVPTMGSVNFIPSIRKNSGTGSPVKATEDVSEGSENNIAAQREREGMYDRVIRAITRIARLYNNHSIQALATTILCQKLWRVNGFVDRHIISSLPELVPLLTERDFLAAVRLISRIGSEALAASNTEVCEAVIESGCEIAKALSREGHHHPLYDTYLKEILTTIVSKGDVKALEHHRSQKQITICAQQISLSIPVLAALLPQVTQDPYRTNDDELNQLFRNAWFNMVVHGYSRDSYWTKNFKNDLIGISWSTPALVSTNSLNHLDSGIELNTVLRRGSSNTNVNVQRTEILNAFGSNGFELRTLSTPKLFFFSSVLLLESCRARAGDCSECLQYFVDPSLKSGENARFMTGIIAEVTKIYIHQVIQYHSDSRFPIENVAYQLKQLLVACCHRMPTVQNVAYMSTDSLITAVPHALCRRVSLFTLLELLTLVSNGCLESDVDEYDPKTTFTSIRAGIHIRLSDSFDRRLETLKLLQSRAGKWVRYCIDRMPNDMKGLLQVYLASTYDERLQGHTSLGVSFALNMGGFVPENERAMYSMQLPNIGTGELGTADFISQYTCRQVYSNTFPQYDIEGESDSQVGRKKRHEGIRLMALVRNVLRSPKPDADEIRGSVMNAVAFMLDCNENRRELIHFIVAIPFKFFTRQSMALGISAWVWLMSENSSLHSAVLEEIALGWEDSVRRGKGLFTRKYDLGKVFDKGMEYAPSNKQEVEATATVANHAFLPHLLLIRMISSHFQAHLSHGRQVHAIIERILVIGLSHMKDASLHPLARTARFELVEFALQFLVHRTDISNAKTIELQDLALSAGLNWFDQSPKWPFGGNKLRTKGQIQLLFSVLSRVQSMTLNIDVPSLVVKRNLLITFLAQELHELSLWLDVTQFSYLSGIEKSIDRLVQPANRQATPLKIQQAWQISPGLALSMVRRFKSQDLSTALEKLLIAEPFRAIEYEDAAEIILSKDLLKGRKESLFNLLFWTRANPVQAINYFRPEYANNPFVIQYAMRSIDDHDSSVTFFYVPEIVQLLRHDGLGYVKRFILEVAKLNQLFAHQLVWNMKANSYKDDDGKIPDPMKPLLDKVIGELVGGMHGDDKDFYEREFHFFDDVTSISGKLKPYIRKPKYERKAKIDEEMSKIKLYAGVYLPSNPDGIVIGIDRKSGKPLQSHAKAPFMATFKIRKSVKKITAGENDETDTDKSDDQQQQQEEIDIRQAAIFKVGDDCRQDVLVLQLISVFRTIWSMNGLDLYVYPYRVTATDPGCGVIDVLPNSISRDMLGREAVNGLYDYFLSKMGGADSLAFQKARLNFVHSLAAYSVVSYILQLKDRHNGNIMYDDQGHILHIDFGFCFDIAPGGVKFEQAPFKLTKEMIDVMGGSTKTQYYGWFEELCIKGFLAARPYAEDIIKIVVPMIESGLPCFKGPSTIKRLRNRFALDRSEKEAAHFMKGLIRKSADAMSTKGYDEFQRLTNGIPY